MNTKPVRKGAVTIPEVVYSVAKLSTCVTLTAIDQ